MFWGILYRFIVIISLLNIVVIKYNKVKIGIIIL